MNEKESARERIMREIDELLFSPTSPMLARNTYLSTFKLTPKFIYDL